jgi:hypothetical protein
VEDVLRQLAGGLAALRAEEEGRDRFPDRVGRVVHVVSRVADAIRAVLTMPRETVIAELTVLPMRESSWP